MKIRVPATSANLGPGFDSCGIALSAYLTINVLGESEFWEIQHTLGEEIPTNEENLLIQTALKIAPELTPKVIRMVSDIPLARGLGSNSICPLKKKFVWPQRWKDIRIMLPQLF